jgi:hypothetical protein
MKFLLVVSLFSQMILTSNAFSSELGKTVDGTNARCQEEADIGNSAYRLKIYTEKVSGSNHEVTFEVNFLKCEAAKDGVGLVQATGDEVLKQKIIKVVGDDSIEEIVERKMLSFSLTAFTESGKLFDKVLVSDLSQSKARVKLSIDESKLEKGEAVLVNGLGALAAKVSTDPEDKAQISEFIGGTYSIHFR